jgi:hypothetical protein
MISYYEHKWHVQSGGYNNAYMNVIYAEIKVCVSVWAFDDN